MKGKRKRERKESNEKANSKSINTFLGEGSRPKRTQSTTKRMKYYNLRPIKLEKKENRYSSSNDEGD